MSYKWIICVTALIVAKHVTSRKAQGHTLDGSRAPTVRVPLTKPLNRQNLKNMEDHRRLSQDYIEQYQEMQKASQESFEAFDEQVQDVKRLRRLIGDDDMGLMVEVGGVPRRRSAGRLQSAAGRRRARSQTKRRNKLNIQGISSHKLHSKQTMEYSEY